jgi:hypothetical protein
VRMCARVFWCMHMCVLVRVHVCMCAFMHADACASAICFADVQNRCYPGYTEATKWSWSSLETPICRKRHENYSNAGEAHSRNNSAHGSVAASIDASSIDASSTAPATQFNIISSSRRDHLRRQPKLRIMRCDMSGTGRGDSGGDEFT